jgi:hypothetical protein
VGERLTNGLEKAKEIIIQYNSCPSIIRIPFHSHKRGAEREGEESGSGSSRSFCWKVVLQSRSREANYVLMENLQCIS